MVLQNAPMPELELRDLRVTEVAVETATTPFDLVLTMSEVGSELVGWMLYSPDLFSEERHRENGGTV